MPSLLKTIDDALSGDTESIAVLLQRFGGAVEHECRKYLIKHPIESNFDDLEQEVIFRVWARLHSFPRGHQEYNLAIVFEGWLRRTARAVLDDVERQRPPQQCYSKELVKLNKALRENLEPQVRRMVEMHIGEGYSLEQIAERMSLSPDNVRNVLDAALAELHQSLK